MTATGEELRVRTWDSYIGQDDLKRNLDTRINAAVNDGRQLDNIYLYAPPGYGKTSLAGIIAARLDQEFWFIKMPITEKEFARYVQGIPRPAVVLLDEIHAAPKAFQEALLPVIDEGYFQTKVGKIIDCSGLTFIGATTENRKVIKPLHDRFHLRPHFADYSDEELAFIMASMADRIGVPFSSELAVELAPAAAFTPRLAGALVLAARDIISTGGDPTAQNVLRLAGLDPDGLTPSHMAYLRALDDLDGTAGMRPLCSLLQSSVPDLEELERLLIRRKLITLDTNGRSLTGYGMKKLGVNYGRRSA
jgi:Holliday junction DNA helicase RuvB